MELDLWSFDKVDLNSGTEDMPNNILRKQADILEEKTEKCIYGKVKNISIKSSLAKEETGYSIATKFELVVPALDNYTYTLFIMYSNPEKNYPLSITVGSAMEDDLENFNPNYECKNKEEFIDALRAILSSEAVKEVVKTLYTKASF